MRRGPQNADERDVHPVFRGRKHVHLMGDDATELVAYARSMGMRAGLAMRRA